MKTKMIAIIRSAVLLIGCSLLFTVGAAAYSDDELCDMARKYYQAVTGSTPPTVEVDSVNGRMVSIHLYKYSVAGNMTFTADWYNINRDTGKGTAFMGEPVDLTPYAPDKSHDGFPFQDVSKNDRFYDSVSYVYQNGLFSGTSSSKFSPDQPVDRAMMVTILYRLSGDKSQNWAASFSDVQIGTYYHTPVAWASNNGIANGTGGDIYSGIFSPNAKVTNEQAAVMLYNYCVLYQGMDASAAGNLSSSQTGTYAKESVSWCVSNGLLPKAASAPKANASRAEIAEALYRLSQLPQSGAGGYRQVLDALSSKSRSRNSVYYDINGDGVKELVITYVPQIPGSEWGENQWAAVYTLRNGQAVSLLEKNWFLLISAAAGELGVVEKDGKTYLCLHEINGGYTYPDMKWEGSYILCEWSAAGLVETQKMTYRYTERHGEIVTSTCQAVLTGDGTNKNLDYSGYQEWLNSLTWKARISA